MATALGESLDPLLALPYGLSGTGSDLEVSAADSAFGRAAWRRAVQEDTRRLYVGVTRARDYLVFAPPAKGS